MSSRESHQPPRLPGAWVLIRDICTFFGGWALIFQEAQRSEIRESVLAVGLSCIGVPGLAIGFSSIADAIKRRNGTDGSQSPPVEPAESAS